MSTHTSDSGQAGLNTLVAYQCPSCKHEFGIEPHLFGEEVTCPDCSIMFYVEPPTAKPLGAKRPPEDEAHIIRRAAQDEETLLEVHPAMFRQKPLLYMIYLTLLVGGLLGGSYMFTTPQDFTFGWTIGVVLLTAAAIGFVGLVGWWIQTLTVTLTLTSKRTILRKGFFSKDTTEVQHDDVRNLQVDQSFFDRLFSVGDIAVSSSGQDDLEVIAKGIPEPEEIASMIRQRQ